MGIVVKNLSATEIQQAQQQAQAIASAATVAVQPGQFVFFAAFDGTNPPGTPSNGVLPYLNIFNRLGLIPERLPGLSFRDNPYHLADLDYVSGTERLPEVLYTTAGQPYNAPAGSEEGYWSLTECFVRVALEHGAITPLWEVDTARLQTQNRLNDAGLTEEDRAAKAGKLAATPMGASQAFRHVVLDLDGDGIQVTDKAQSDVTFDVDDSGFLKATGWLANEGADTDGYLWLDRNWNGDIDTGSELFSKKPIAPTAGLCRLAYLRRNRVFLHSRPKWTANRPADRAAA